MTRGCFVCGSSIVFVSATVVSVDLAKKKIRVEGVNGGVTSKRDDKKDYRCEKAKVSHSSISGCEG